MTRLQGTIQSLSAPDLIEAGAVLDAAFGRTSMVASVRVGFALQPDNWLCAKLDGRIIAVAGAHNYGPFASLGPTGVHPSLQRSGVGLEIMKALVHNLRAEGASLLFLDATAAGSHLYPKLGFVPDGETVRLRRLDSSRAVVEPPPVRPRTEPRASEEDLRVSRLGEHDLAEVAAFDTPLFGADRGQVIAAFGGDRERAFVARNPAGCIAGYLISNASHIGPWAAASPNAASRLLAAALTLPFEAPPMLTCPAANLAAVALLEKQGFAVTERLLHMRLGGTGDPRKTNHIYAQASLSLG